jgi:hypothetical protein
MDMVPVMSTNVSAVGFDNGTLRIQFFNGSEYEYSGVPESVFNEMKNAVSAGAYFAQHIKGQYSFVRV